MSNGKLTFDQAIFMSKILGSVLALVLGGYGWMFATFVSASDFEEYIATVEQKDLAANLDRVGDKIDELDPLIFNIKEQILEQNTADRRLQLNKYQTKLKKYQLQQACYLANGNNCRKIG